MSTCIFVLPFSACIACPVSGWSSSPVCLVSQCLCPCVCLGYIMRTIPKVHSGTIHQSCRPAGISSTARHITELFTEFS